MSIENFLIGSFRRSVCCGFVLASTTALLLANCSNQGEKSVEDSPKPMSEAEIEEAIDNAFPELAAAVADEVEPVIEPEPETPLTTEECLKAAKAEFMMRGIIYGHPECPMIDKAFADRIMREANAERDEWARKCEHTDKVKFVCNPVPVDPSLSGTEGRCLDEDVNGCPEDCGCDPPVLLNPYCIEISPTANDEKCYQRFLGSHGMKP